MATTAIMDKLTKHHGCARREDLLHAIGSGEIILGEEDLGIAKGKKSEQAGTASRWLRLVPFVKSSSPQNNEPKNQQAEEAKTQKDDGTPLTGGGLLTVDKGFNRKKAVIITDRNIDNFIFGECCHPIPGDDILGFIDSDRHIVIHSRSCSIANKLKTSFGNRILDAKWSTRDSYFEATITLRGIDEIGLLNKVTNVLSTGLNINMTKLVITTNSGLFEGTINLRVRSREDVEDILSNLKKISALTELSQLK